MKSSPRREALRAYLLEVVRDLVLRGVLKKQQGQSLTQVLNTEMAAVLKSVQDDIVDVATEMGVQLAKGIAGQVFGQILGGLTKARR